MSDETRPSLWQVMRSVLSSFFGVQSTANRERDFRHGSPAQFVMIGLLFTALFVLGIWGLVKLVLYLAGV